MFHYGIWPCVWLIWDDDGVGCCVDLGYLSLLSAFLSVLQAGPRVNVWVFFHYSFKPAAYVELACGLAQVTSRFKAAATFIPPQSIWSLEHAHIHTQDLSLSL